MRGQAVLLYKPSVMLNMANQQPTPVGAKVKYLISFFNEILHFVIRLSGSSRTSFNL